jgi:hypothetical protein
LENFLVSQNQNNFIEDEKMTEYTGQYVYCVETKRKNDPDDHFYPLAAYNEEGIAIGVRNHLMELYPLLNVRVQSLIFCPAWEKTNNVVSQTNKITEGE